MQEKIKQVIKIDIIQSVLNVPETDTRIHVQKFAGVDRYIGKKSLDGSNFEYTEDIYYEKVVSYKTPQGEHEKRYMVKENEQGVFDELVQLGFEDIVNFHDVVRQEGYKQAFEDAKKLMAKQTEDISREAFKESTAQFAQKSWWYRLTFPWRWRKGVAKRNGNATISKDSVPPTKQPHEKEHTRPSFLESRPAEHPAPDQQA